MKKIIFTLVLVFPILLRAQTSINDGLKAYYKFDGNFADSSGNNNHGVNNSVSFASDRKGNASAAANFNGSSSYLSIPASTSLNSITTDFSVSSWVYITNWFAWGGFNFAPILCKSQVSSAAQYRFTILENAFDVISNTKKFYHTIPNSFNKGTWYHVAMSNSGDSCSLYINGMLVQVTLNEATFPSDTNQLLEIGRDYAGTLDYFNGYLDELRIYNRPLTSQNVTDLYNFRGTSVLKVAGNNTNFNIYPNPSNGSFYFENNGIEVASIEIINSLGETIFESNSFIDKVEINNSRKGIYFVKVIDKNNLSITQKVIIE